MYILFDKSATLKVEVAFNKIGQKVLNFVALDNEGALTTTMSFTNPTAENLDNLCRFLSILKSEV